MGRLGNHTFSDGSSKYQYLKVFYCVIQCLYRRIHMEYIYLSTRTLRSFIIYRRTGSPTIPCAEFQLTLLFFGKQLSLSLSLNLSGTGCHWDAWSEKVTWRYTSSILCFLTKFPDFSPTHNTQCSLPLFTSLNSISASDF